MKSSHIIGSRGSDLALWQARHIQTLLRERAGAVCEIKVIRTKGDRIDSLTFEKMEGKGFFTKEIEDCLISREIDIAVHSLKDLPTAMVDELVTAAIPKRADPRDVLLVRPECHAPGREPLQLRAGARVGTSSVRRREQIRSLDPDAVIEPLRGNVPTRLRRLLESRYDAIVLAAAGIERLGLDLGEIVSIPLAPEIFVPAPGQGALAVQLRRNDAVRRELVARIHDKATAQAVERERSLLGRFGGGCSLPLGACMCAVGSTYAMSGFWTPPDGGRPVRVTRYGGDPVTLLDTVHRSLLGGAAPLDGKKVVVTRATRTSDPLAIRLNDLGAQVVSFPVISIVATPPGELDEHVRDSLESYDWILFPSATAVTHFGTRLASWNRDFPALPKIGAVGPGTARPLLEHGHALDYVPDRHVSDALLEGILARCETLGHFLIPCAREGRDILAEGLEAAGHAVTRFAVYETVSTDPSALDSRSLDGAHYLLFASPSAVRSFLGAASVPKGARIVTIGPVTGKAARDLGLRVDAEAEPYTMEGMIECILRD